MNRNRGPLEKVLQVQAANLIRSIGGRVYNIGTKRKKTEKDHGTRQSRGIPDVCFFLGPPAHASVPALAAGSWVMVWYECKRPGEKRSPEQVVFGELCAKAGQPYVWGDVNALGDFLIKGGWLREGALPAYRRVG